MPQRVGAFHNLPGILDNKLVFVCVCLLSPDSVRCSPTFEHAQQILPWQAAVPERLLLLMMFFKIPLLARTLFLMKIITINNLCHPLHMNCI